jgi:glycine/D-amino acid oxidase-like deaminating enzyme
MSSPAPDALIVGAGIVGAWCAHECMRAGLRVTVLERGAVGGGATAAGMGHLVVMDDSEAQFALTHHSQQMWREIAPRLPARAEPSQCGTLWVAADAEEMAEVRRKHAYYAARGIAAEVLDEHQLYQAEPNLRAGLSGGLLVPGDGVVYPPVAAEFLLRDIQLIRAEVVQLNEHGARLSDGTLLKAGTYVNATGMGAARLTPGVRLTPRKGHLLITDRYPGFVRHQLVELGYLKSAHTVSGDSVAFNAQPRPTGQVLIGSSRQTGVETAQVDQAMLETMLRRALLYLPGLAKLNAIRCWTGVRAATPDKLPLIGPYSERIALATGHEGLGITTAPATGHLIAALLSGHAPAIDAAPYLPARCVHE